MYRHIREKGNTQLCKLKHHNFCYVEAYECCSWLAGFSGEIVIYAFLLGFFSHSHQKRVIWVLCIRDYLIVLITTVSHKAHLLSYALRRSSKLQKIQNLENFVSMAIQGTQVLIYTNTLFFFLILFWKTNKIKTKQPN